MKQIKKLKKACLAATLIGGILFGAASCSNSNDPKDTKAVAENTNDAKTDSASSSKDADFLIAAAGINLTEMKLSQLAQQKGIIKEVMALGTRIEEDHTKSFSDETALASSKNIAIPTSDTYDVMNAYNKLDEKTGKDFDNAYCDMMISSHKDAIKLFEKAATDATDPDIKTWAASMLPSLHEHLTQATACQAACEITNYTK